MGYSEANEFLIANREKRHQRVLKEDQEKRKLREEALLLEQKRLSELEESDGISKMVPRAKKKVQQSTMGSSSSDQPTSFGSGSSSPLRAQSGRNPFVETILQPQIPPSMTNLQKRSIGQMPGSQKVLTIPGSSVSIMGVGNWLYQSSRDLKADLGMIPQSPQDQPFESFPDIPPDSPYEQPRRCPLCFDEFPPDQIVTYGCEHCLCEECFRGYLESKIMDGRVADDEICCPIPDCQANFGKAQEIPLFLIEHHLRDLGGQFSSNPTEQTRLKALWEKFLEFRMRLFLPDSGKILRCPYEGCEYELIVSGVGENEEYTAIQCPSCEKEFCGSCGAKAHAKIANCNESKRRVEEEECLGTEDRSTGKKNEKLFEDLLQNSNWCRCPICKVPVERESGCNFMSCPSLQCRGKTFFCYVCGEHIKGGRAAHYKHYPLGPYEDFCIRRPYGVSGKQAEYPEEERRTAEQARRRWDAERGFGAQFQATLTSIGDTVSGWFDFRGGGVGGDPVPQNAADIREQQRQGPGVGRQLQVNLRGLQNQMRGGYRPLD